MHPLDNVPASFTIGPKWFVFYTQINSEKRAEEAITALGFPVFIPFEKRIQRAPHRKPRSYETALFPRYGFVRFDPNDRQWGAILTAKFVSDLLRSGGVPQSVPEWKIDALKLAMNVGVFDRTKPPGVGMGVEITGGPFAAFVGKIKRARTDDRMDVVINFLGGEVSAQIPTIFLREIPKETCVTSTNQNYI